MSRQAPELKPRPCWVVITSGKREKLEPDILRAEGFDEDEGPRWEIIEGRGVYLAVVEYEPGAQCSGEEELAVLLSSKVNQPVYVLWLDEDTERVQAFVGGAYAGEVRAAPDDIAAYLGCTFPGIRPRRSLRAEDLRIDVPPVVKPGETKIAGRTIAQWKYVMKEFDWAALLDGASESTVEGIVSTLTHPDAEARALACKLTKVLGVHGLGTRAEVALSRLREVAAGDRDRSVSKAAKDAARDLEEAIEREAVRAELPWVVNFNPKAIPAALAAIDDPRLPVRREVYFWWGNAWDLPEDLRRLVAAKLRSRLAEESDELAREACVYAIKRIQGDD